MRYLFQKFLQVVFPHSCILCHGLSDQALDLCSACLADLPTIANPCPQCALPLPVSLQCGQCLSTPPPFDATFALFTYDPPLTKLIMELKFHECLINASILGQLLAQRLQNDWYYSKPFPDVIIPVPLHKTRLRERGFNQALELAKPLQKGLKLTIAKTRVTRQKTTQAQARLSLTARKQNLKNAFQVEGSLEGLTIAILDDVITTGQTITELAKTLKSAGAKSIHVWCIARTNIKA